MVADAVTLAKSMLVFSPFCVNVSINKALPNFITLNSKWGKWTQALVYENATLFFQKCGKQGHIIADCKIIAPKEPFSKGKNPSYPSNKQENQLDPSTCNVGESIKINEMDNYPFTDGLYEMMKSLDPRVKTKTNSEVKKIFPDSLEDGELSPLKDFSLVSGPFASNGEEKVVMSSLSSVCMDLENKKLGYVDANKPLYVPSMDYVVTTL